MSQRVRRVLLTGGTVLFMAVIIWPFLPGVLYDVRHTIGTSPALQKVTVVRNLALPLPALSPGASPTPAPTEDTLVIPAIGVQALIRQGSDISVLDRVEGVWHQTGDQAGNYVIAGHRFKYLPPNTQTLYSLDKLQIGDEIELWLGGVKKVYTVHQVRTVTNNDVSILNPTTSPQLLIYTCVDLTYAKRLVVVGVPE